MTLSKEAAELLRQDVKLKTCYCLDHHSLCTEIKKIKKMKFQPTKKYDKKIKQFCEQEK